MSYYLKGKITTPFFIVSGAGTAARVLNSSLVFDLLTTSSPGEFMLTSGRLSMTSPSNKQLGYDLNNNIIFSTENQSFNFVNEDNTLKGLYAGINYSVKSGTLQLKFGQEPASTVRLVPIQWYIRQSCTLVTDQEPLAYENNFVTNVTVPAGTTEFGDCHNPGYDYCPPTKKCGTCYGACESGGDCVPSDGSQKFKCLQSGPAWSLDRIHPVIWAVVIAAIILAIFFIAAI